MPRHAHRPGVYVLLLGGLLLGLAAGSQQGCSPTYVNIPPERGDLASSDPNGRSVRHTAALALNALLAQHPVEGEAVLVMPAGTTERTYQAILGRVDHELVSSLEVTGGEPAEVEEAPDAAAEGDEEPLEVEPAEPLAEDRVELHVEAVRLRTTRGQYDIRRLEPGRADRLHTVFLHHRGPGFGWSLHEVRTWRIPN